MTAKAEHVPQERGFDMVAALFGAPASEGKLADAALAPLMHGIMLDCIARRMPGPGRDVLAQEARFVPPPAPADKIVVAGSLAFDNAISHAAAEIRKIVTPVAGADRAGIVPGARLPLAAKGKAA